MCRLSVAEAAVAGHETRLSIEMGPVSYVHTKRFVQELQAFARDFSLLRRVIMQARLKVNAKMNIVLFNFFVSTVHFRHITSQWGTGSSRL